jgi:hypothetical protein
MSARNLILQAIHKEIDHGGKKSASPVVHPRGSISTSVKNADNLATTLPGISVSSVLLPMKQNDAPAQLVG